MSRLTETRIYKCPKCERVFDADGLSAHAATHRQPMLSDGTVEDAIELLYWQFDTRRSGTGFRALADGTKRPQSERDAFKDAVRDLIAERDLVSRRDRSQEFIVYMLLWCPECGGRHVDEGEFETKSHHTHACQHCGHVWRPTIGPTCGVRFLPGFKNDGAKP